MIIGHQKQWQYLKSLARADRIPHALLFCGPKHLGKTTVALEFVKLLNAQVSGAAQDIDKGQYPDLVMIEPALSASSLRARKGRASGSVKKEIRIGQIRDLVWKLSLRPYRASLKTAIIDSAHTMNQEAQSCLLKTLEEPKGRALLILISEYPETLLATILSRVEKLVFYSISCSEMEKHFPKEIISLSFGRPGQAVNFLRRPEKLKERKQQLKEIARASSLNYVERFQYVKQISDHPEKLKETLELWLRHFRKCLRLNLKHFEDCSRYVKVIKSIERTLFLLSGTNVNPKLALESLMLEL